MAQSVSELLDGLDTFVKGERKTPVELVDVEPRDLRRSRLVLASSTYGI